MNKLVIVSGPRGAGKETLVTATVRAFPCFKRVVGHTTRTARQGEVGGVNYHFVSDEQFDGLVRADAFVSWLAVRPTQRSGLTKQALLELRFGVIDVSPVIARKAKEFVLAHGGQVLLVGIFAPPEERRARILSRQPDISDAAAGRMMAEDPVSADEANYRDYNLLIENFDGAIDETLRIAETAIGNFLQE